MICAAPTHNINVKRWNNGRTVHMAFSQALFRFLCMWMDLQLRVAKQRSKSTDRIHDVEYVPVVFVQRFVRLQPHKHSSKHDDCHNKLSVRKKTDAHGRGQGA